MLAMEFPSAWKGASFGLTQQSESGNQESDGSTAEKSESAVTQEPEAASDQAPEDGLAAEPQPDFMPPPPPPRSSNSSGGQQAGSGFVNAVKKMNSKLAMTIFENDIVKKLNPKVAMTIIELDFFEKLKPVVAKTIIDNDACLKVVSKLMGVQEAELKEKLKAPGKFEPKIDAIAPEQCRKASPCGENWDAMSGTDRLRLCAQCKLFVYDFNGMDHEAAMALVFKRESKTYELFFKRADSRFLIQDCPVGVKKRNKRRLATGAGTVIGAGLLALLCFMPRQQPSPTIAGSASTPQARESSGRMEVKVPGTPQGTGSQQATALVYSTKQPETKRVSKGSTEYEFDEQAAGQTVNATPPMAMAEVSSDPNLPSLPKYSSSNLKFMSGNVHTLAKGGSCYKLSYESGETPQQVLDWYDGALKNYGYRISQKGSQNLFATNPEKGSAILVLIATPGQPGYDPEYQAHFTVRYLEQPPAKESGQETEKSKVQPAG